MFPNVHTCFVDHPKFCTVGTGVLHGSKAVGGEVGQVPPSSFEVKNEWIYTYTPSGTAQRKLSFTVPC